MTETSLNTCKIDGYTIGDGSAPYIIAEVSGNHADNLDHVLKLMTEVSKTGANAIKFQTYTADSLTLNVRSPDFFIEGGLWDGQYLYDLYEKAHTPWDWFGPIFEHGKKLGITVFSSPFDHAAVDLLERFDAPAYKIASPELLDWSLIEYVVQTGKPFIVSTGAASLTDILETQAFIKSLGATNYCFLHCISAYPAPTEDSNLSRIKVLEERLDCPIGLSDHSEKHHVAELAIAAGATVIEKHVKAEDDTTSVDAAFSLTVSEFSELVQRCNLAHKIMGTSTYGQTQAEKSNPRFNRVIYTTRNIAKGEILSYQNIRSIRGPKGACAKHLGSLTGRVATRDIPQNAPVFLEDTQWGNKE
ncbi:pseudaminic acid synthase [Kiloniella laminariae]|uniref:pseudaminic acid synthase n=1 Tax=Kiloniella laminariae TaxID=454162 RepID=UPI00035CE039|nr:pseudaminic acid synthase [Kiloniella laminariae]